NPHMQTLWGRLLRNPTLLARSRERLWLMVGVFLDMYWHGPFDADKPLVLVIHDMTGSSNSPYVAPLQKAMAAQRWPSITLNWRG
ncbi:hydrolase, partial [Pseudomonas syringae pv. tagetis]